ncbi:MAG TPA: hypothetical protein VHB21_10295 [Minicystis sp.]|nr:hypothetical protein [Minicystis sp.]
MRPVAPGPYREAPRLPGEPRSPQGRGAAVVVAVVTWLTVLTARSPLVLLGALALTVPVVARRVD